METEVEADHCSRGCLLSSRGAAEQKLNLTPAFGRETGAWQVEGLTGVGGGFGGGMEDQLLLSFLPDRKSVV